MRVRMRSTPAAPAASSLSRMAVRPRPTRERRSAQVAAKVIKASAQAHRIEDIDAVAELDAELQAVETEALSQAIAAGGETWEADIVAAFYRLSKTEERLREDPAGASAEFEARNRDFHRALIAACPSPWLHRLHGLLYQQSERYRRLVVSKRAIPRDVHAEH